jgi:hypothetical protein
MRVLELLCRGMPSDRDSGPATAGRHGLGRRIELRAGQLGLLGDFGEQQDVAGHGDEPVAVALVPPTLEVPRSDPHDGSVAQVLCGPCDSQRRVTESLPTA